MVNTGTGFSSVTVVVLVRDANDNAPQFRFPALPEGAERGKDTYFGVVSRQAQPFTPILKLEVMDGLFNGFYSI